MVHGLDVRAESHAVRAQIGYLPAEMPLYGEMSGRGLLAFLSRLQGSPPDRAWTERLCERFAIGDVDLSRRLGDLSHGMKRKFGIVQALMGRPKVLILDEPTSGLDPLMIEAFAETIAELKRAGGTTVFLSSHVLSEVERLCDRIGVIRRGSLVRESSLEQLRREMPRRVRITFAGPAPPIPSSVAGSASTATNNAWNVSWRGPLGPLLAAAGARIDDVEVESFKLEDYVLSVYAEGA
jgi:ABC-2 type transport system ATP-binding protein